MRLHEGRIIRVAITAQRNAELHCAHRNASRSFRGHSMSLNPLRPGRSIEHSSTDEFGYSDWHGQTKKLAKGKPCKRCGGPFDQQSTNGLYCGPKCRKAAEKKRAAERRRKVLNNGEN